MDHINLPGVTMVLNTEKILDLQWIFKLLLRKTSLVTKANTEAISFP